VVILFLPQLKNTRINIYIILLYYYIIIYKCLKSNLAHANPAPAATNGHSNTNAALTATIRKVFHNANIANTAQGALPPVSPLAYGIQVHKAYGASAFKCSHFNFHTFCAVGQGDHGGQSPL
jgi:hypothetical protein